MPSTPQREADTTKTRSVLTPSSTPAVLLDPQTELANRDLFVDRVEMALLRSFRHPDQRFAVLSVSVEQIVNIETTLGFEAAQEVLREFARRLKTAVRNYDSIGRITSDQFGILLETIRDESDAARVSQRVHESLRSRIATRWGDFMVSAHIGAVLNHAGADSAGRLMQLAGLARLRARESGAPYEIYDLVMQEHARERLQKEMELRRAIQENQFELHYQPIVSMETGRIVQTEALLRWRHPQRGLVAAGDFIALAEETGLAVPMGWFALGEACRQLSRWRSRESMNGGGALAMSINVTAAHFRVNNVGDQMAELLEDAGVSKGVNLEVTERLLIGDPRKATEVITRLRQRGVGIHLDDFGTGYSSLQYLHDFPFDAIKIDRSFISRMGNGGRDAKIVATIRELARQLEVPVIAEGVETAEHLDAIRALGCEYAQGYFFAKPMPPDQAAQLIVQNPHW